jgi:NAD(P)H-hydrate epimerase
LNDTGGASLATAGSGDVLTGVIAGFLARGVPAFEAAVCAAWVHGRAAERVADTEGATGVVASDVVASIAPTLHDLALHDLAVHEDDDR